MNSEEARRSYPQSRLAAVSSFLQFSVFLQFSSVLKSPFQSLFLSSPFCNRPFFSRPLFSRLFCSLQFREFAVRIVR